MLSTVLTLLAAKAKVGALVAGTALVTTATVGGGGAIVLQSVSDDSPVTSVEEPVLPSPPATLEPAETDA